MRNVSSARVRAPAFVLALLYWSLAGNAHASVEVTVAPARLQLGLDGEARVEVTAPAGSRLTVQSSVGEIADLKENAPGRFSARYIPPKARYPQVAIISAIAHSDGVEQGFAVLPLWGLGEAVISTRPGAIISVEIADTSFGPVEADKKGRAAVPVQVPPGTRVAHHGAKPISLELPETSRIFLATARRSVPSDQRTVVEVFVYTIAPDGTPSSKEKVVVRADRGTTDIQDTGTVGVRLVRWTIGPELPGVAKLDGIIRGEAASLSAVVVLLEARPAREAMPETIRDNSQLVEADSSGAQAVKIEPNPTTSDLADTAPRARSGDSGISFAIAAKLGVLWFRGSGRALMEAEAGWNFTLGTLPLRASFETGYGKANLDEGDGNHRARLGLVPLVASLAWRPSVIEAPWRTWAGIGIGLVGVVGLLQPQGEPPQAERGRSLVAQFIVGAGRETSMGTPFGEVRLWLATSPGLQALPGPSAACSLVVGYAFEVP